MSYPKNQMEFEDMFKTEQDCINYLTSARWPKGFECPTCGSIRSWEKSKKRFECIDCHTEITVTAGTIFHKSTKPLRVWFQAIWWIVAKKKWCKCQGIDESTWTWQL